MFEPEHVDLLLVDDDPEFRGTLARRFLRRGYQVYEAADGNEALVLTEKRHFQVAVLDMIMPGLSGLDLLERIKASTPECQVILLSGQGSIDTAVQAMKLGAFDFLTKPCPLGELEVLLQKAVERGQLASENEHLRHALARTQGETELVGQSPAMMEVLRLIQRAGPTDSAILIQGESGTGKEVVARMLHRTSNRATKPLVTINCAALPETLLESELFGHERGSFTGAVQAKPGLFEVADGGTLFIDEIGEMPASLQAKLLRVLENGELRRVGSLKERRVHVRLLAATNRKLSEEVRLGRFREDLYYRINVMSLELPALRVREGDVPLLIQHFLGNEWTLAPAARQVLEQYSWPGNVRQLSNAIERAKIMADGRLIQVRDLPAEVAQGLTSIGHTAPLVTLPASGNGQLSPSGLPGGLSGRIGMGRSTADHLAAIERGHILEILRREGGNKARAARSLGINRRRLYRLLEKHQIELESRRPTASSEPTHKEEE